ncbi:lytic transglycosylase domain-containing protein [Microvirga roseola]|uniref:lytic transglycosylase domain-containing protein n=1 Tax=Microvirga roseola TaxID=2883126 RepID=UPI001E6458DB|nr:lytic transglycosylase domain-containing protein [Microvirga roseola]
MTWRHLLRTLAVAILGAAALALASHARAEGGEGSSLVSPEQAEAFLNAVDEAKAGEKAAATEEGELNVEQTAAIPSDPLPAKSRTRQADAVRAAALKPLIVRFATEHGVPYELADAVIRLESRYNPGARNGPNMGLTQINIRTAQSLGYKGDAAGLLDAETNLRFGLKYLAQAFKLAGGDLCGTILRYQFGHRTTTMTNASRAYCAKVKVITASAD